MDPGDLLPEVDIVAQDRARARGGAQGVEGRGDDGGRHLLVVEDGDGAGCDDGDEDGQSASPPEGDFLDS